MDKNEDGQGETEQEIDEAMRHATEESDQKAQQEEWRQRSLVRTRKLYDAGLSVWIYEQALINAGYSRRAAHELAAMVQIYFLEEAKL